MIPSMIPTTLPELNDLLGGGFPNTGLSLITGAPMTGKTMLVVNLLPKLLASPKVSAAIISEDLLNFWETRLRRERDRQGIDGLPGTRSYCTDDTTVVDIRLCDIIVVDGLLRKQALNKTLQEYARKSPLIVTVGVPAREVSLFASVILHLERFGEVTTCTVVKNREGPQGGSCTFCLNEAQCVIEVPQVEILSKWVRLLGEDII